MTIVGEHVEVEEVAPACPWVAEAICAPVPRGATPDVEHALHRICGKASPGINSLHVCL